MTSRQSSLSPSKSQGGSVIPKSGHVPKLPFPAVSSSSYPKSPASYHQTSASAFPATPRLWCPKSQDTGSGSELRFF